MTVFQEAEMLHQVPFFAKVDMAKLKLLAFTSRAVRFAPGEPLMVKHEPSDAAYVILEGEVEVMGETTADERIRPDHRDHELAGGGLAHHLDLAFENHVGG
ncbi:MAG: hypothetical protein ACHP91_07615, partial [Burkholderiales bacterium]